jgi:small ligand-binding sensory domain FIST
MRTAHGVVETFNEPWNEQAVAAWARGLRANLAAASVTFGVLFVSPSFNAPLTDLLEVLRLEARIPVLVGASTSGGIHGGHESEQSEGFVLALYHIPGAKVKATYVCDADLADHTSAEEWHRFTGIPPSATNGWLLFADPFQTDNEAWLRQWNLAYPGVPIIGGLATGNSTERQASVFLDGKAFSEGTVALSIGGAAALLPVVSQGCCPIGDTWTITRAERNFILGIGNRPAYSVLVDTYNRLPAEEQQRCRDNIMVGFASDEYRDEFEPGDFLVRQLIGADPRAGALAVGAKPRAGQTIQFQRRDSAAASTDLIRALERTRGRLTNRRLYGGLLWTCCGRGRAFFGTPDHDAALIQEHLGPLAVAGTTANGEIGPVGSRSFFHAYTASLALIVSA